MSQKDSSRRARNYRRAVHGALALLAVLCVVGIAFLYAWGKEAVRQPDQDLLGYEFAFAVAFGVLDIVAIVWVSLWLFRQGAREPYRRQVPLARLLSLVLLGVWLAVAIIVFFFATCNSLLFRMSH
jgi:hypothetical protein